MGTGPTAATWTELTPWWRTHLESRTSANIDPVHPSEAALLFREWPELDTWWQRHLEDRQTQADELRSRLERLNEAWRKSESRFDRDPLVVTANTDNPDSVPLRPNQEENQSSKTDESTVSVLMMLDW